jgi:ankyrin repeat protein
VLLLYSKGLKLRELTFRIIKKMYLLLLPIEVLDDVVIYLSLPDILALIRVCKQLHAYLIRTLYRRAQHYKTPSGTVLTAGLQDVTFWFDEGGNSSVIEWTIAYERNLAFKSLILEPNTDLLQADSYGVTLLHRLSGQGLIRYMEPLIKRLKQLNINPFQLDLSRLTPLHYAAGRGMTEAVQVLITYGADVSAEDHHGNTPLHLAAVTGSNVTFAQLVRAGADVNAKARFGWTPIDQASITHHRVAVDELRTLGSLPPTWRQRHNALNEFVRLSPCPLDCYVYHTDLS